jgi:hypothetical protein
MNFAPLLKAINTALIVSDAVRRLKGEPAPPPQETAVAPAPPPASAAGGQLEARLANVVVAALKEAFDRDHARLELERAHLEEQRRRDVSRMELERAQLEEQRRRAEEALRAELRRHEADRELARLRLLAGTALVGWIASVVMFAMRPDGAMLAPRIAIAGSCCCSERSARRSPHRRVSRRRETTRRARHRAGRRPCGCSSPAWRLRRSACCSEVRR